LTRLDTTYSRGERGNTNTSTDEQHRLILQKVLRCRTEGTVDHDAGQDAVQRWAYVRADDLAACILFTFLTLFSALLVKVTTEHLGQVTGKVTDDADVD